MAKKVKNPIELKAVLLFHEPDGEPAHVDIVEASIHYGADCEHGNLGRRGSGELTHNDELLRAIKDFFEDAVSQANVIEGLRPPDYGSVQWVIPEPEPDP